MEKEALLSEIERLRTDDLDIRNSEERDSLRDEVAHLRHEMRWLKQTIHQAHHWGPIDDCPRNTCAAIELALTFKPPGKGRT